MMSPFGNESFDKESYTGHLVYASTFGQNIDHGDPYLSNNSHFCPLYLLHVSFLHFGYYINFMYHTHMDLSY